MQADYAASTDVATLLDPAATVWSGAKEQKVPMMGTPAAMQPTEAISNSWASKKIGAVSSVKVRALHNGSELAFRLEWDAPNHKTSHGNNSEFPDGAAIAFPVVANAPVMMGAPEMPINIWFWRANGKGGDARQIGAAGIGTSDTIKGNKDVVVNGVWANGKWSVVIARKMAVAQGAQVAQLKAGESAQFSLAVWDGSSGERGGIKSFSGPAWLDLSLVAGN
jgi:DMSO reductase family type II enzyme heme b subunit